MAITREELLKRMFSKMTTVEEVRAVMAAEAEYLKEHPDDREVLGAGESLYMLEAALLPD